MRLKKLVFMFSLLFLLSACQTAPTREITLAPFSCLVAYCADGTDYRARLQFDNVRQTLSFVEPQALRGLALSCSDGTPRLSFGGTNISLSSLTALPLPDFAPEQLFCVLAELTGKPVCVPRDGVVTGYTNSLTYELSLDMTDLLPLRLSTDDHVFFFSHASSLRA